MTQLKINIMKKILPIILLFVLALISYEPSYGQSEEEEIKSLNEKINYLMPGKSKFLLRGYAHSGIEYIPDEELTFVGGAFNPLFIYRQSDKLLFEAELETAFGNDEFEIALEYANISYLLSKTMTLRLGKIIVPFGIFTDRLHPAWINKFPTPPLGFGHDGILPNTDIGIELSGGAYAGNLKYNYAFYLINGPQLNTGEEHEDDMGKLEYGKAIDNNFNKSMGTRIGILPFANSSLEIGFSAMIGKVGKRDSEYQDIGSQLYAIDLTYVKNITFLKSVVDFKGQASWVNVDNAVYVSPEDLDEIFEFENKSSTYFAQLSLRPAFIGIPIIENMEFATRYSTLTTPEGAPWETNENAWDFSLNYWLDWRTVLKVTYQRQSNSGEGHDEDIVPVSGTVDAFFVHWAIGF
jgi:hypothetical protein